MDNGGVCLNCGATLHGPWCSRCGQKADHSRSIRHLAVELGETLTHADSRLWHTLRGLLFAPGRLTREFLDGRRAGQIPPLRLFLVTLFVLFGTNALFSHAPHFAEMAPQDRAAAGKVIGQIAFPHAPWLSAWFRGRLMLALDRPEGVVEAMREWIERITLLMPPIYALLLRVLFIRRPFSLFDHAVFALHSLSFACIVFTAMVLTSGLLSGVASPLLLLCLPVQTFRHLRGAYGIGTGSTLLRMVPLVIGLAAAALMLSFLLALLSLEFGTHEEAPASQIKIIQND
ncbi:DUF3667 domain-containing protein [Rhizosaccharibacter radicis]|uniref:DUF3667 domain-containing protein n=1 Tax=Rhizosaccharibacter radicis TaxID=2782605 RepID=A0ABT1VSR1_9PROT|nr:DUF3667 domain-containing protein [Acetobacteraceae bacterium KSS12]